MTNPIDKVARAIYDNELQRMNRLVGAADEAVGQTVHTHTLPRWESCNLIYRSMAIAALRAIHPTLEAARDEILWWRDEHPCCAGHETEALDAINQVPETNPNTGREG